MTEQYVFPMSVAQVQMWFLNQLQPDDPFYNIAGQVCLRGRLDVQALEQSIAAVLERHECLRTTFDLVDGQPSQIISAQSGMRMAHRDLSSLPPESQESQWRRLAAEEAQAPFDLRRGPLLRCTLLRLGDEEHVLLASMHHIIADGWSLAVFTRELAALYSSYVTNAESNLHPLPIQYADYACWESEQLASEKIARQIEYWRGQLADAPELLSLPTDRPRPAMQSHVGDAITFELEPQLVAALEVLGRERGNATLFMILLAAFAALLHRYSGEDAIVIGCPVSGRQLPETEELIGLFVNTLPVRIDCGREGDRRPNFAELIDRVRETVLSALSHQDVPFAKLAGDLKPSRTPSHNPLFQVAFVLQNTPALTRELEGLSLAFQEAGTHSAKLDLALEVIADEPGATVQSGYRCKLEYNAELFDKPTVQRMVDHYRRLLWALRVSPHTSIAAVSMLSAEEQYQLISTWNDTFVPHAGPPCLHQRLTQWATECPHAVALDYDEGAITYAELDACANQIAAVLRGRGVGAETVVGVHGRRSWKSVAVIFGIFKAGATYLPLDPDYPGDRLRFMIADAGCRLLFSESSASLPWASVATIPNTQGLEGRSVTDVIDLDSDWYTITAQSSAPCHVDVDPSQLAYIIYTSGSTGQPKGVAVCHRGLSNLAQAQIREFEVTPASRVLQFASWNFDASMSEIAMALGSGASLCLMDTDAATLGAGLMDLLRERAITHVTLPPSLLAVMPDAELPALSHLIVAGERCPEQLVQAWGQERTFLNAYGPTESSVCASLTRCEPEDAVVTIGRPIDNVRLHILDDEWNLLPVGVPGELYIGGESLARGYVARPALTATAFIPDPFAAAPGARLYRTGDRARYRQDGSIEFLGRIDYQVKVRGHRVELGEVEAAIQCHPAVLEVAVLDIEADAALVSGRVQLVAFVILRPEHTLAPADMRTFLAARLPAYMCPTRTIALEAMPMTASGKVDRRALRLQVHDRTAGGDHAECGPSVCGSPGANRVAERLLAIFAAACAMPEMGIHDNFFDCGGDSIVSIQVAGRARKEGLVVTPKLIFQYQTVAELVPHVKVVNHLNVERADEPVSGPAPLTPIQHWFFAGTTGRPHHFNQSLVLEVAPELDASTIAQALEHVVQHHDALGVRFTQTDTGWLSVYGEASTGIELEICDLQNLPDREHSAVMDTVMQAVQSGLDIERGPLLRGALFRRGADAGHLLCLAVHHLVIDAVSWRTLGQDLATAYEQLLRGEVVRLPAKSHSFKHWADKLVQQGQIDEREQAHWADLVARVPPPLPLDREGGSNHYGAAEVCTAALSQEDTERLLGEAGQAYQNTVPEILLMALARAVGSWANTSNILIEIESHGREDPSDLAPGSELDVSRTVGWFTTLYPLLVRLQSTDRAAQLKTLKEQVRSIPGRGHNYLRWRYAGAGADISEDTWASMAAATVGFNYLGRLDTEDAQGSEHLRIGNVHMNQRMNRFDVDPARAREHVWDIVTSIQDRRLMIEWIYSRHLHHRDSISALVASFQRELEEIIAHCMDPASGGFTPSDFPQANLSQDMLDRFVRGLNR